MQPLEQISMGVTIALLIISYAISGQWAWLLMIVGLIVLWLIGTWRAWPDIETVGFILVVGAAALGSWLELPAWGLSAAVVMGLISWDIGRLRWRLAQMAHRPGLLIAHARRLSLVVIIGLSLVAFALEITLSLNFLVALLLGLFMVISLSSLVRRIRLG